jgi:hypothetical protein
MGLINPDSLRQSGDQAEVEFAPSWLLESKRGGNSQPLLVLFGEILPCFNLTHHHYNLF